jgi:hypothetical protein
LKLADHFQNLESVICGPGPYVDYGMHDPRIFQLISRRTKFCPAGLTSCLPDQELGALTKELASRV